MTRTSLQTGNRDGNNKVLEWRYDQKLNRTNMLLEWMYGRKLQ